MTQIIRAVEDRRTGATLVKDFEVEPLIYDNLTPADVGRTVVYRDRGRAQAGTLTSWRNGTVWARYHGGDTAAGAEPWHLSLVVG